MLSQTRPWLGASAVGPSARACSPSRGQPFLGGLAQLRPSGRATGCDGVSQQHLSDLRAKPPGALRPLWAELTCRLRPAEIAARVPCRQALE